MDPAVVEVFQHQINAYYTAHGRHDLPWRLPNPDGSFDPYKILVSEIMLQQTQVVRVVPKFEDFMYRFPDIHSLAAAPLGDVLIAWSGLGYNRRAKHLWLAAKQLAGDYHGTFPQSLDELITLPGVGKNTAGAILVYAFNLPAVFIETNIRTVFIHHFFNDRTNIADSEILDLVGWTLPRAFPANFRTWYWSLMDYGMYLKQTVGNRSVASRAYSKQSPFTGSRRQIRGKIIRMLATQALPLNELNQEIPDPRLTSVLDDLCRESMISRSGDLYSLKQ